MSDAVDVQDDVVATEYQPRPSILPPPTLPAALLASEPGYDDAAPVPPPPPPPPPVAAPAERPEKQGLLIRLAHLLCGGPNHR